MKRDDLRIASPCTADFSNMSPVEALKQKGRFCADCKKVVHDLSRLSEREARTLLAAPRTEGLCVRYLYDEVGEIVFRRELDLVPVSRLARVKRAATAAAMLAIPLSLNACMGAAPAPQPVMPEPPPATATPTMGEAPPLIDGGAAPVAPEAPSAPVAPVKN